MKRKKVIVNRVIHIDHEDDKMTITLAHADEKRTVYVLNGWRRTKGTAELVIADYIYHAVDSGLPLLIDERLADEFKAIIADSPYKGEFKLAYTDGSGRVVNFPEWEEPYPVVYATPYHVEIRMFGDKVPLFEILYNGHALRCTNRCGTTWRKKEVDDWIIKLYQTRKQYPNLSIEVPRIVAALFLDSLACNPRIVRELNITLTEEQSRVDDVVA